MRFTAPQAVSHNYSTIAPQLHPRQQASRGIRAATLVAHNLMISGRLGSLREGDVDLSKDEFEASNVDHIKERFHSWVEDFFCASRFATKDEQAVGVLRS